MYNIIEKFKLEQIYSKFQPLEFFHLKRMLFETISYDRNLSQETKLKVVSRFENLRYVFFREFYGLGTIDN